ncbi:MAG: alpha/beta fold hydrolase [Hyphomicrobium sp.]|nr:alpha/beta fold hydrolase [Hyphomicrobium sp.]
MSAYKDHSYSIDGGSTGVLLVHGLCGSPTEMRFVANGLARAGYTVVCPQLAGHCNGDVALEESRWQDWLDSAERALVELSARCDRVIVGGLSTGAVLGLMLAQRHPEKVAALALYSPTLWLNGRHIPWYARAFQIVRWRWLARLIRFDAPLDFGIKDERLRELIKRTLAGPGAPEVPFRTPGIAALERQLLVRAAVPDVPRIKAPVLILHPREDDYAHLSNAAYLQEKLGGRVELVVLDDSYHLVTIDRQRSVVLERTADFIGRMVGRTGQLGIAAAGRAV